MTAEEFVRLCGRLRLLTQGQQAEFLGVSLRTAHGYANGASIPGAVTTLLRVMDRFKITADQID